MAAEKITLTIDLTSTIQEVLAQAAVPASETGEQRTVSHNQWNVSDVYTTDSTPEPQRCLSLEITLDGGGFYDLNLASAPTTAAPTAGEDLTGFRVMHFEAQTPSGNAAAIVICDQAASNKYTLFGSSNAFSLPKNSKIALIHLASLLPVIAAGVKTIRFSGTTGDKIRVKMTFE